MFFDSPYHLDYSQGYVEGFQYEIDRFMVEHLSRTPPSRTPPPQGERDSPHYFPETLQRYYTIRNQTVFVLFIFDRRMDINQRIETDGLDVDLRTSQ